MERKPSTRTTALPALALTLLIPATVAAAPTTVEDLFTEVVTQAREQAGEAYVRDESSIPGAVAEMSYDQYRAIRFRPEAALWRDDNLFEVQLFHPGFLYREPVTLHEFHDGNVSPITVETEDFIYEGPAASIEEAVGESLHPAGFRLHYPLNSSDYKDELIVFLGASYFRVLGREHRYGLSGRGLAIDTASDNGEEFSAFREFWLVRPGPDETSITIIARLDSPSVTGAYRFDIQPGDATEVTVDARLFARRDVDKLGLAPLTSMFFHGDLSRGRPDDFRRHVHDSDGLLMRTSAGEWLWRPLSNPERLRISSLRDSEPGGFGLLQRAHEFDDYLDLEARYELRPSHWIETLEGDWGSGGVELVEIPSESEVNDNIVAYWVPEERFRAGDSRRYRYRLSSFDGRPADHRLAESVLSRQGWAAVPGEEDPPPRGHRRFVVDFHGGELSSLAADQPVQPALEVSDGRTEDLWVRRLPDGKTWRASFRLVPDGAQPADMRLSLAMRGRPLSETWTYVWYPDANR